METLLGYFYTKINMPHEDIVSEGLVYILEKSIKSKNAIFDIIATETNIPMSNLSLSLQSTGEHQERPDISCLDSDGKELLIIENKFWASLTYNQPNTYLERLKNDGVLLFIVPEKRKRIIYDEIAARVDSQFESIIEAEPFKIKLVNNNKFVLVKSWTEILNLIKYSLETEDNKSLLSDLNQLIGLCENVDKNSFLPITDQDLSPSIPRKVLSYYDVANCIVDELLINNKDFNNKGLFRTPLQVGFCRYFRSNKLGLGCSVRFDLWSEYHDTPFWLFLTEDSKNSWFQSEKLKILCRNCAAKLNKKHVVFKNDNFIALQPPLYKTEDFVVSDLATQVENLINYIEKEL
ncbi:MAG: PD-(D/E)XK nuclease family protein [Candidatus Muiribacteriota bacterium]